MTPDWKDLSSHRGSAPACIHPHVIVQNYVFNTSKINTVVVCAITSNIIRASAPGNVMLKKGESGLKKDSVINISQVITVDKSDLVEKIGTLPPSRVRQVIEGIKLLIEPRDI